MDFAESVAVVFSDAEDQDTHSIYDATAAVKLRENLTAPGDFRRDLSQRRDVGSESVHGDEIRNLRSGGTVRKFPPGAHVECQRRPQTTIYHPPHNVRRVGNPSYGIFFPATCLQAFYRPGLKTTVAKGGRVMTIDAGRPWLSCGSAFTPGKLPTLLPP